MTRKHTLTAGLLALMGLTATPLTWAATENPAPRRVVAPVERNPQQESDELTLKIQAEAARSLAELMQEEWEAFRLEVGFTEAAIPAEVAAASEQFQRGTDKLHERNYQEAKAQFDQAARGYRAAMAAAKSHADSAAEAAGVYESYAALKKTLVALGGEETSSGREAAEAYAAAGKLTGKQAAEELVKARKLLTEAVKATRHALDERVAESLQTAQYAIKNFRETLRVVIREKMSKLESEMEKRPRYSAEEYLQELQRGDWEFVSRGFAQWKLKLESFDDRLEEIRRQVRSEQWEDSVTAAGELTAEVRQANFDCEGLISELQQRILDRYSEAARYVERGEAAMEENDLTAAVECFTKAIQLDPNDADHWFFRGDAAGLQHNYDLAIADCIEAIRLDPKKSSSWHLRGSVYLLQQKYDQAIADFTEAIKLNPDDAAYWCFRAAAACGQQNYDQAIADCIESIRLNPKHFLSWQIRGTAYLMQMKYDQAISDVTEAIRLNPDIAVAWSIRGQVHLRQGNYDQALADFVRSRELDPNQAEIEFWLSAARGKIKERGQAQKAPAANAPTAAEEEKLKSIDAMFIFEVLLMTWREGGHSESEKVVLNGLIHWLSLSDAEYQLVSDSSKDREWNPRIPESYRSQAILVYAQVRLILADGKVDDNEARFAKEVKEKLSISEDDYKAMVEKARKATRDLRGDCNLPKLPRG